jgi:hypothetical protein
MSGWKPFKPLVKPLYQIKKQEIIYCERNTRVNFLLVCILAKDLTKEQLTPRLDTKNHGLGHYQQKNSNRETIMPYIENFRFWQY